MTMMIIMVMIVNKFVIIEEYYIKGFNRKTSEEE